ncbi:thioredoxin domain-containing protein [Chlorobium ferrooxidans]|uniref:Spermatogenesis-associated protein 20-like TRX domain-containing protein n=1 Tax=Chlorobium ferrooxidans DSM 13031 TaxID=377431 RepID=Q0YP94_9CHLB|nr:thioredoxin domain-containing protein [Chlorobium ferrooxidans]EAT58122.1 Protein of unknown function DUF255 [Chlorobium ferrooxidans DSM 13031]
MTQPARKPNRLIREKSPYLLQHAHNPVDWYAWGEEAFEKAERENRPIFLSVGYSTCHWCHVMERESFENPDIAEVLNRYFVPVKVDREELPDLDRLYMEYVQSTTGRGGWPMSVWLTPDRNPFYGGSYFPPEDRYGMTGFKTILLSIASLWESDEEKIRDASSGFFSDLQAFAASRAAALPPEDEAQHNCFRWLESTFDPVYGGFSGAPKFPRPVLLNFLFSHAYYSGNSKAREMALFTLRRMAEGGIHDHISVTGKGGGGFARYSTDERWHVPHFEKMLYDNAQLAVSYLEAFQCSGEPLFRSVAEDIFNYVLSDMTAPEGGFYSAEDADSLESESGTEKKEGAFYLWRADELHEAIGNAEQAAIFSFVYGVRAEGNALNDPHGEFTGRNILMQQVSVEETAVRFGKTAVEIRDVLDEARRKLYTARSGRPRPFLDDKILTSWNALMISALSKGFRVLHSEECLTAARKAADFLLETLYDRRSCRLLRRYRDGSAAIAGKVDDYAFFVQALIDLYEASFEIVYLKAALELAEVQKTLFCDALHGGYFSSASDDQTVPVRQKESYDGAEPSANSVTALNLLRLGELTGKEEFALQAEELFSAFGTTLASQSHALPQMLVALNFARKRGCRILFSGDLHATEMERLRAVAGERYLPGTVVMHASAELAALQHVPETVPHGDLVPQASVCVERTCLLPVRETEQLAELLDRVAQ